MLAHAVLAVDLDAPSIELARATTSDNNIDYLCADVMRYPFEVESFDAVVSVPTYITLEQRRGCCACVILFGLVCVGHLGTRLQRIAEGSSPHYS
jgi:Methyltransferase domain